VPLTGWGLGLRSRSSAGGRPAFRVDALGRGSRLCLTLSCEGTTPWTFGMSHGGTRDVLELWRSPAVSAPLVRGTSCSAALGYARLYAALTIGAYSFGLAPHETQPWYQVDAPAHLGRTSRLRS